VQPGFLVDANVLIALVIKDHVHHNAAMRWYRRQRPTLFLCPIVEGALMRLLVHRGHAAADGQAALRQFYDNDRHSFAADSLSYMDTDLSRVVGHQQMTDAYLAALARELDLKLVTFDTGRQEAHRDVAVAIRT
jgi:uncharacterized protein